MNEQQLQEGGKLHEEIRKCKHQLEYLSDKHRCRDSKAEFAVGCATEAEQQDFVHAVATRLQDELNGAESAFMKL